jgi:hypothetical protein
MVGPREVLEIEVRERPPSTLTNDDSGPPGGVGARGSEFGDIDGGPPGVLAASPTAATTEVEDVDGGPPRVLAARSGNGHHRS